MPPHPDLTDAQLREIVQWILSLKDVPAARATQRQDLRLHSSRRQEDHVGFSPLCRGQRPQGHERCIPRLCPVQLLLLPLPRDGRHRKRARAQSSTLPGDGMTTRQFLAVAMPGREDKGMPSWAGFLSEEEMTSIYRYVKGRSLGLVPVGRPPSETNNAFRTTLSEGGSEDEQDETPLALGHCPQLCVRSRSFPCSSSASRRPVHSRRCPRTPTNGSCRWGTIKGPATASSTRSTRKTSEDCRWPGRCHSAPFEARRVSRSSSAT